jgi:hypothetical protein
MPTRDRLSGKTKQDAISFVKIGWHIYQHVPTYKKPLVGKETKHTY